MQMLDSNLDLDVLGTDTNRLTAKISAFLQPCLRCCVPDSVVRLVDGVRRRPALAVHASGKRYMVRRAIRSLKLQSNAASSRDWRPARAWNPSKPWFGREFGVRRFPVVRLLAAMAARGGAMG